MKQFFLYLILSISLSVFSVQENWESFKNTTISFISTVPGWCSKEKALLIMDLIKKNQFQQCVEIGVFAGASLFPIIKTLQYNQTGMVFAVDAWSASEAVKGFKISDPNYTWWSQLDYDYFYNQTINLITQNKLQKYCRIIKQSSQKAINLFADNTIDFIHFDGNHNAEFVFQDVFTYFPKIKNGGYILLNDPNWFSMMQTLVFLLERCDIISPFNSSVSYLLLRKNDQRMQKAILLFKQEKL